MNLHEIKDIVRNSRRKVYTIRELSRLIGKKPEITRVYISRLVNKGFAKKLRDKIIFDDNDFVVSNQLIEPSYVSLHSALFLHKNIKQIPEKIELVCPIDTIHAKNYIYHKLNPKLFFGYEKIIINSANVYVATPEKALIDGLYLRCISIDLIKELIVNIDKNKLNEYITKLSKLDFRGKKKLVDFFRRYL